MDLIQDINDRIEKNDVDETTTETPEPKPTAGRAISDYLDDINKNSEEK